MSAGLDRVFSDVPVRTGFLEATAGVSSLSGAYGRLESGVRVHERLGLFGFGEVNQRERMAGIGARWTFGL